MPISHLFSKTHHPGRGVATDYVEALQWIRSAAEQGYPDAQDNLSQAYAKLSAHKVSAPLSLMRPFFTQAGVVFPDFSAQSITGQDISLAQFKGKVVLVNFWSTSAPPCVAETPNMKAAYKKYHNKGFEIVSISINRLESDVAAYIKNNAIPWTQVCDGKGFKARSS